LQIKEKMSQNNLSRYFIAILPPTHLIGEIEKVKTLIAEQFKSSGAKNAPAHITMHMPFLWKPEKQSDLISRLQNSTKKIAPFEIQLNNYSHFDDRVIFIDVIKNNSLIALQSTVVLEMKQLQLFNQADDKRGFHPHITVAFRDLKKEQFHRAWDFFKEKNFQANFTCHSFSLLMYENKKWKEIHTFSFEK
jgi:2'-5' RNA ligase